MSDVIDEFEKENAENELEDSDGEVEIPEGASENTLKKIRELNDAELDELLERFGISVREVSGSELTKEEKIVLLAQEDDKKLKEAIGLED